MRVLIAGGKGFLGSALKKRLESSGHEAWILTRQQPRSEREIHWDGHSTGDWVTHLARVDAVVNATGYGLEHWPWTRRRKRLFQASRVLPAAALLAGIAGVQPRPRTFLQISGINYYGARGAGIVDEDSPPAVDYLAKLTTAWEVASLGLDELGVRRVVARTAVVLAQRGGLFPLMALPARMFAGGPLGDGKQAVPWIHLDDQTGALSFLLEAAEARGAFNLIAPEPTSNEEFMRAVAEGLHRPFWLRAPAFALRLMLGEMSTLVLEGRFARPRRLVELGFDFRYPTIRSACQHLLGAASR